MKIQKEIITDNKVIIERIKTKHCANCPFYRESLDCDNGLCEYKNVIDIMNKTFNDSELVQWLLEQRTIFYEQYVNKNDVTSLSAYFTFNRVLDKIAEMYQSERGDN